MCREPRRPVQEIIKVKGIACRLHDVKFLGVYILSIILINRIDSQSLEVNNEQLQ